METTSVQKTKAKKRYYNVEDVMDILEVSRGHAYKLMKKLKAELDQKGFITVSGKVPVKYFNERCYIDVA